MEQSLERSGLRDACASLRRQSPGHETALQLLWLEEDLSALQGVSPLQQCGSGDWGPLGTLEGIFSRVSPPCQLDPAELNDPAISSGQQGRDLVLVVAMSHLEEHLAAQCNALWGRDKVFTAESSAAVVALQCFPSSLDARANRSQRHTARDSLRGPRIGHQALCPKMP